MKDRKKNGRLMKPADRSPSTQLFVSGLFSVFERWVDRSHLTMLAPAWHLSALQ